jgi:hypothetical protein
VKRNVIRLAKHVFQALLLAVIAFKLETIVENHIHAEREAFECQRPRDAAESDQTERLARDLRARVLLFQPFALAHGDIRLTDVAREREHMTERKLSDGAARGGRRVAYFDAFFLGVIDVNVVDTDATTDNQLQIARRAGIDLGIADFCRAADDDCVNFRQSRQERVAFIFRRIDNVTEVNKSLLRRRIDTVIRKN